MEESRLFCELILDMGRKEKKLEVIRQVLCEIAEFEPYSAFRRIDKHHKNFLDQTDLFLFLSENKTDFSESFIRDSILQHYDLDLDGKLIYAEYSFPLKLSIIFFVLKIFKILAAS